MRILVHGRGVSAMTAAWILAEQGYHNTIVGPSYNQDLQVAINQDTLRLLNEIFQIQLQEVPTAHWIRGRLVGWNGESDAVNEGSLSIRTGALTHALESQLTKRFNGSVSWTDEKIDLEEATFTFEASTKLQDRQFSSLSFGKRVATIASARMSDSSNFSRVGSVPKKLCRNGGPRQFPLLHRSVGRRHSALGSRCAKTFSTTCYCQSYSNW